MTKGKKILLAVLLLVITVGAILGGIYIYSVEQYQNTCKNMVIKNIDVSQIKDGKYYGECDVNYVSAKVEVIVNDGKIEDIKLLEHKNDKGKKAEVIPASVLSKQSLQVDTISGATNSSKVILKAIENALTNSNNG